MASSHFVKVDAGPMGGKAGRCLACFLNFWTTGKSQIRQQKSAMQAGDFESTCMHSGPDNKKHDEEYSFG
jgi:hypothetical protein